MKNLVVFIILLSLLILASSCTPTTEPASSDIAQISIPPASTGDVIPSDTISSSESGFDVAEEIPAPDAEPRFAFPSDWTVIECLNEEPNLLFDYRMIGESEDAFFLGVIYKNHENEERFLDVRKVSKSNYTLMAKHMFPIDRYPSLQNTGSSFINHGEKQAEVYDYNFKLIDTIAVPEEIQAKMVNEYSDEKQMYLHYFAGYVVTADGSKFYYSNEEGLFEFDSATRKQTLLLEVPLVKDPLSYHYVIPGHLQLRAGERVLFFTRPGYEGLMDAGYIVLPGGTPTFLSIHQYAEISYEYSPHYLAPESGEESMTLNYFNLITGETSKLMNITNETDLGVYFPASNRYCGFSASQNSKRGYYRYDTENELIELVCKENEYQIASDSDNSGGTIFTAI